MITRALTTVLVAAAVLIAALSASSPAQAAKGMEFALQDDAVLLSQDYYNRDQALAKARDLGVTRLRVNLPWSRVLGEQAKSTTPPSNPVYNWAAYDALVDAAAAYGMRVQFALVGGPTPAFATPKPAKKNYKPSPVHFAAFARAAALHFAGRVDRYSIWNEPNWTSWLGPQSSSPQVYRALYVAGYAAIKGADPRAQVLIGETQPHTKPNKRVSIAPLKFLRQVLCLDAKYKPVKKLRCAPLVADGYAHHPYEFTSAPTTKWKGNDNVTIGVLDRLTNALTLAAKAKALRSPRGKALDVYLTEFGYFATGSRGIPDAQRAQWLKKGYEIAAKNPRVRQNVHYLLAQPPAEHPSAAFNTGLVLADGTPTGAFNSLRAWSQKARAKGQIKKPGGPIALRPAPPS